MKNKVRSILRKIILWAIECPERATHPTQVKLLALKKDGVPIYEMGLRKLGRMIGESHPQKVKHHRNQLLKVK